MDGGTPRGGEAARATVPMSRRTFLGTTAAAAGAALAPGLARGAGARRERPPNIVFVLADDLGYGELGCYGQDKILTPCIDRMAAEGTRFTSAYAGSTVCAPSRCALMTGKHLGHCTVRGNKSRQGERVPLQPEDVTVAEVLRGAGYATAAVGKWGLGEPGTTGIPNRQGFDFWFGYLNQANAHSYYPPFLWQNEEKVDLPGNLNGRREQYSHDLMTNEALAFIEGNRDRPFFLYLAYTLPHAKLEPPDDVPYTDRDWPQPLRNFASMVTRLDTAVGKVLSKLENLGIDENTIVFFTSDNGPHREGGNDPDFFRSSGPLRGIKRDLYEGGIRVPMIARWPGRVSAGTVSDQPWAFWDVLPTAAELSGTGAPEGIDGISMAPAILRGERIERPYFYWEFFEGGLSQAARMGDWKAVRKQQGAIELYDLSKDLGETNDVAPEHPDVVAKIAAILRTARTPSEEWPVDGGTPE